MVVKVTPSVFNCIKTLLAGGASHKECADYMKLSTITVGRINRAETYEDYKQSVIMAKLHSGKPVSVPVPEPTTEPEKEQKPEKMPEPETVERKQTIVIQATHYMMEEQKKTNELLTLISNKLSFIVEQLS